MPGWRGRLWGAGSTAAPLEAQGGRLVGGSGELEAHPVAGGVEGGSGDAFAGDAESVHAAEAGHLVQVEDAVGEGHHQHSAAAMPVRRAGLGASLVEVELLVQPPLAACTTLPPASAAGCESCSRSRRSCGWRRAPESATARPLACLPLGRTPEQPPPGRQGFTHTFDKVHPARSCVGAATNCSAARTPIGTCAAGGLLPSPWGDVGGGRHGHL